MDFSESYRARWADMDFNQHMRNAAFLGCAEETRMRFLDSRGFGMAEFQKQQFAPVVLEDRITYKHELRLLEAFRVDVQVAASTRDLRRLKVRNRFFRESDGALCATVESVFLWFDLKERKPRLPPEPLKKAWSDVSQTDDFEWYESTRA
jgi:acyl-CoA thioester hydrolase